MCPRTQHLLYNIDHSSCTCNIALVQFVRDTNWHVLSYEFMRKAETPKSLNAFIFRLCHSMSSCMSSQANKRIIMRLFFAFRHKSLFITGRTSIGAENKKLNIILYQGCLFVYFFFLFVRLNIVTGHLGRPYSTHTAPMPVLTGSVHAHILTKPSRAGFAVIRLEFIEPGAATCV